jgi:hypothetical protein
MSSAVTMTTFGVSDWTTAFVLPKISRREEHITGRAALCQTKPAARIPINRRRVATSKVVVATVTTRYDLSTGCRIYQPGRERI